MPKHSLIAVSCLLSTLACTTAPERGEQLFNGKDMTGWRHVGKGEFVVENGALKTVGGMGLLVYDVKPIGGAVVRIVYKAENPLSNAGVFIRIPEQPQDAWYPVHKGYEIQVQDEEDEFHRTGSIYSLAKAEAFTPSSDGWNTLEIALDGQMTTISVNGKVVNTFRGDQPAPERVKYYEPQRGPRPDSGYIGLQNHDEKSTVWFREISLHALPKS